MTGKTARVLGIAGILLLGLTGVASPQKSSDVIVTPEGEVRITPIVHASVMLEFAGKVIHVDPTSRGALPSFPKPISSSLPIFTVITWIGRW